MHNFVIDTPESVESHDLFIPLYSGFHVTHSLVVDHMVNLFEVGTRHKLVKSFLLRMGHETRQERAVVIHSLNESVHSVVKSLDGGH